jgi:ABC-type ATPase with predicted acetyltransferase domain
MKIDCLLSVPIVQSPRAMQLVGLFDVPPAERSERRVTVDLPIEDEAWAIGLVVGPSGSGKSTLAREAFGQHLITGFDWPADRSLVDGFPADMPIKEITSLLSSVGFSSPPSWLKPYRVLSNGEQFRATLARAMAESPDLAVIDEFTSVVDRTVAQIGSAAVAKSVRRAGRKLVAVTCHYDVIDWLDPDWIIEMPSGEFARRALRQRPAIELEVCRVHRSAWEIFKPHHYLDSRIANAAE